MVSFNPNGACRSSTNSNDNDIYIDISSNKQLDRSKYHDGKPDLSFLNIDKDGYYPKWVSLKIFTITFMQTDCVEEQKKMIVDLLAEFPQIRRFVCFYDYSEKIIKHTYSKHHFHGWACCSSWSKLWQKYGSNKKGLKRGDHDLLIWFRDAREGDTPEKMSDWRYYCEKYVKKPSF